MREIMVGRYSGQTRLPNAAATMRRTIEDRALREFLADICDDYRFAPGTAGERKYHEFLAAILPGWKPPTAAESLRPVREVNWDPAKHPREGGPPNAGWWAPTGGAGGFDTRNSSTKDQLHSWPSSSDQWPVKSNHDHTANRHADALAQSPPGSVPRPNSYDTTFGKWNRSKQLDDYFTSSSWASYTQDSAGFGELRRHLEESIPKKIRDGLFQAGIGVAIGDSLKQMGHPNPDDKGGLYEYGKGVIILPLKITSGTMTVPNQPLHRNARHEFGHAFDHMVNGSTDPNFLANFRNDLKANPSWREGPLEQFVPKGKHSEAMAAREAFAEAFAAATNLGSDAKNERGDAFAKHFPLTSRYLVDLIKPYDR